MTTIKAFAISTLVLISACTTAPKPTSTQTPTPTQAPTKPKIALVLGGGGAKGFAHVGVIEALETHGIKPDLIVGTSSGAMVGAIYASGKSARELTKIALTVSDDELLDFTPSKQGLIAGNKLRAFVNKHTNYPLEKLPTPFVAVATEMHTDTPALLTTGETGLAVQASASVPKLFIAPRIPDGTGKKYVDGGQSALVPARVAKNFGADIIISVNVLAHAPATTPTITASLSQSQTGISATWGNHRLDIPLDKTALSQQSPMVAKILSHIPTHTSLRLPQSLPANPQGFWQLFDQYSTATANPQDLAVSDVVISPNLTKYSVFNLDDRQAMIEAGKVATLPHLPKIATLINHYKTSDKNQH